MKKITLNLMALLIGATAFCQNDVMVKHNGEKIEVKVVRVAETTIIYKFPGEDAEQTIGKFAVNTITYGGSHRVELVSDKITVNGEEDWEKVQILTDKSQVLGLKQADEVRGKTSGVTSFNTAASADKKATRRIREAAAKMGASFVLLTSDKASDFGVKQSIKNGVAYTY
jgi:hypothetical protein